MSYFLPCSRPPPARKGGITLGVKGIKTFVSCRLGLKGQKKRHFPLILFPFQSNVLVLNIMLLMVKYI